MEKIGVTLLSGGLDSTTVTAYARERVGRLTALTFLYGQTHSKEIQCAVEVAQLLGVRHELLDISGFAKAAWYSSLTNPGRFTLPLDRLKGHTDAPQAGAGPDDVTDTDIPSTYVPLRNSFFLTIAGAFLESMALHAVEVERIPPRELAAYLFMAPNAIDYSGYPDCRPEYYAKMRDALMHGSKLWTQYHVPIDIETPIIHLSKAEIVKLGMELHAPLDRTWSCYQGGDLPCGRCDSCALRAKGFEEAGYGDPLLVRLDGAGP